MIFLNPAVLFGLLAASIPVLIHLLNLRKLKRVEFSTLAFLKELQKNKIRKLKLKQWLLLALRVLIILFLVLAFARPTLKGLAIGGTTSAAKTTSVFVLDDTYSMSVIDANGSYFNQAKQVIKNMIDRMQEGDEISSVLVSHDSKKQEDVTSNLIQFKEDLKNIDVLYATGTLHNSIVKAAQILNESQNFNKEIFVLSDFQNGRLIEKNITSDLSQLLNEKVKIYTIDFTDKEVFNASIDDIKVNTQIFEKDKPVNFSVTVTNNSSRNITDGVISLFMNGERSSQQSYNLEAGKSQIFSMDAVVKNTGFTDVFAQIEDDDILYDNKRFTNFYVPEEIPVIIFYENSEDINYLKLALTASENNVIKVTEKNINQISSYNLNNYEVVFVVGEPSSNNSQRLNDFVNSGGGLFILPAGNSDISSFNNFLNQLSLPEANYLVGEKGNTENLITIENVEYNHPVFKNIFLREEKKEFESPEVYLHFNLKSEGKGLEIINLMDDSSLLTEFNKNNGKVFLLSVAPVFSWSNLPIKSIFVPLINKSVFYLSSKNQNENKYFAGDKLNINVSGKNLSRVKIIKPDNQEVFLSEEDVTNNTYLSYPDTYILGNYKIFSNDNLIDLISVNTNPVESKIDYYDMEEFRDYLNKINFKGVYLNINKEENIGEKVLQARFGSELWKYFLLLSLILAIVEMTIAQNTKKELAETK